MSLLNPDVTRLAADRTLRTALQHTLVLCAGLNETREGQPFYRRTHATGEFVLQVERSVSYALALHGSIRNYGAATVDRVLRHVKERFDPEGKLVLWGYSCGGYNSLSACQQMDSWWYRYALDGRPGRLETTKTSYSAEAGARVKVDLLVTVDPCASRDYGEGWITKVPACVKWAQNWYQRSDIRPEGFKGVALNGDFQNYRNAQVCNPHVNHENILDITRDWSFRALMEALGLQDSAPGRPARAFEAGPGRCPEPNPAGARR